MNFETTLELYGGGPGSGRRPGGGSTDPIWTSGWVKKDGSFIPLVHNQDHYDAAVKNKLLLKKEISPDETDSSAADKVVAKGHIRVVGSYQRWQPVQLQVNNLKNSDTQAQIGNIVTRLSEGTPSILVEDLKGDYREFTPKEMNEKGFDVLAHDPINLPKRPRKIEVPDDGFPTPRPTWKTLQKENYKSAMKKKYPKFPFLTTPGTQPLQPIQGAYGKKEVLQLPKGLTKKEAWKLACKKAKYDFRGAKYNPETGKMILCSNINDAVIDEVRAQANSPKKSIAVLMNQMVGIGPGIHWPRGMK